MKAELLLHIHVYSKNKMRIVFAQYKAKHIKIGWLHSDS